MTGDLVRLDAVTRRFPGGTVALSQVSLSVRAGESVAVVGRSGSGKSTLLNLLGLLDAPDEGTVFIDGHPLERTDDAARTAWRAADMGFVFQRAHLVGGLSVHENVALGLRYCAGWDGTERALAERVAAALADVQLSHRADARASTLSGGEMQRVAIARTLVRDARLWLADEPTGNLDTAQSAEIVDLLHSRARHHGAALVVVTHEPDIAATCDRIVTLQDGRVVSDITALASQAPAHQAPHQADPARGSAPTGTPPTTTAPLTSAGVTSAVVGQPPGAYRRSRAARARRTVARTLRFVRQGAQASPGRTRAGVLASAVAVALTVAALGLSQSAAMQVTTMFDARRATQVTASFTYEDGTSRWPITLDTLTGYPGVTGAELWQQRTGVTMSNGAVATTQADLYTVEEAPGAATDSVIAWATGPVTSLRPDEVVLGKDLAARLGVTQLDLSPEVTIGGTSCRVAGILTETRPGTATGTAFVTPQTAASMDGLAPAFTSTVFAETTPGAARQVADRITALADPYALATVTVDPVLRTDAYRGSLEQSVSVALTVLAAVASLAGLAGVVLVNVLTVTSRVPEFGLRRALGSRRVELIALVVAECASTGLVGAVLGFAAGFVGIMAVTAASRWQPVFDPRLTVVPLAAVLVFSVVAALFPAVVAARTEPADAVRT